MTRDSLERIALRTIRDLLPGSLTIRTPRVVAVARRLGLLGQDPVTLQRAGDLCGLTRERIRQLEGVVKAAVPLGKTPVGISEAIRVLRVSMEAGTDASTGTQGRLWEDEDPAAVLHAMGLAEGNYSPGSLIRLAGLWGENTGIALARPAPRSATERLWVHSGSMLDGGWQEALDAAKRESGRLHLLSALALVDVLGRTAGPNSITEHEASAALRLSGRWLDLGDGWYWFTRPSGRCTLVNASTLMLTIAGQLDVPRLREGIRRRQAGRSWSPPPSTPVLRRFYDSHPDFEFDGTMVALTPTTSRSDLSSSDQRIVEIFDDATDGVLTRREFLEAARSFNMKMSSAGHYITYSPLIEQVTHNVWTLRGTNVEAGLAQVKRDRAKSQTRPKESASGVTADGDPWFACRLRRVELDSSVFQLDALCQSVLGEMKFLILNDESGGRWHLNTSGSFLYGAAGFLARWDPESGDVLRIDFDLVGRTALLELGGDELLLS